MSERYLHVYAQHYEHSHSHIVGSVEALTKMREMIDRALIGECSEDAFLAYDGEEYNLRIIAFRKDNPMTLAKPYTDESSREKSENVVWPHKLCIQPENI